MKKIIYLIIMNTITNFGIAQTKTTTTSSESSNYTTTFDMKHKEEILNYLKKEVGENYKTSKDKLVWSKISNLETKNDKTYIKLEDEKIEINYQNKNNLLNPLIVKKLKKVSDFIESTTK
jgi:hypothetical protein